MPLYCQLMSLEPVGLRRVRALYEIRDQDTHAVSESGNYVFPMLDADTLDPLTGETVTVARQVKYIEKVIRDHFTQLLRQRHTRPSAVLAAAQTALADFNVALPPRELT